MQRQTRSGGFSRLFAAWRSNRAWRLLEQAQFSGKPARLDKARSALRSAGELSAAVDAGQSVSEYLRSRPHSRFGGKKQSGKVFPKKAALYVLGSLGAVAVIAGTWYAFPGLLDTVGCSGGKNSPENVPVVSMTDYHKPSGDIKLDNSEYLVGVSLTGNPVKIRSGAGTDFASVAEGFATDNNIYEYLGETDGTDGNVWFHIRRFPDIDGWVSGTLSKKLYNTPPGDDFQINTIAKNYDAIGVQAAVVKDGAIINTVTYGWSTIGSRPMDDSAFIRSASLSKAALAVCAMKMQEEGKLDLSADIGDYWGFSVRNPSYPSEPVTIRQLFTETSTMVYHDYAFYTLDDTAEALRSDDCFDRSLQPGKASSWLYCSFGTGVAGTTMELALGDSLLDYSEEKVFAPLGVNASFASGRLNQDRLATLYAANHTVSRTVDQLAANMGGAPGENINLWSGGLTTTASDMARIIGMLACDGTLGETQLLSADSVNYMEERRLEAKEYGSGFMQCLPMRYCEGIYGQSRLFYHTGNAYGVLSLASYNPDTRCGVVVMTTGAADTRDSYGIYAICGEITQHLYSLIE